MVKKKDDELSLEQLLSRAKELPADECFDIYYDPDTRYFYIYPYNVMAYWIPVGASFIGRGVARLVSYTIEIFISQAVNKLIREVET